jgi:hypothetical protein
MTFTEKYYTSDSESKYWFYYTDSKSFMITLDPRENLDLRYSINLSKDNKISFATLDEAKQYVEKIVVEVDKYKKLNKEYLVNEPAKFVIEISDNKDFLKIISNILNNINLICSSQSKVTINNNKILLYSNITGNIEEILFFLKNAKNGNISNFTIKLNNGKVYEI